MMLNWPKGLAGWVPGRGQETVAGTWDRERRRGAEAESGAGSGEAEDSPGGRSGSFLAQGGHGVHAGGTARGNDRGRERHGDEQDRDARISDRVVRGDTEQ